LRLHTPYLPTHNNRRLDNGFPLSKNNGSRNLKLKLSFLLLAATGILVAPSSSSLAGQSGIASVYSTRDGLKTASGARMSDHALAAAHRTLPFGSRVQVTNRRNGKSVVVTINDRGPFIRGRIIDLTPAAARALGFSGLTQVSIETRS